MCGICGISGDLDSETKKVVKTMNDTLFHRGPDEEGYYIDEHVGLGMRRLSILDLEHGSQPIFNSSGDVCTVFNGEIYNYKELKGELEAKGYEFKTQADTEVIVHLYDEYGDNFVTRLRGMFAIALWDSRSQKLIIARDQIGIKPLFYSYINGRLIFGSEIKSILPALNTKLSINHQALDAFLTFMFVPAPLTIYKEISKLEAGHYLILQNGTLQNIQYWDFDFPQQKSKLAKSETKQIIENSIKSHLQSDVPMGAFVSGGVDSSLVASIASRHLSYPLNTFTVFFGGKNNSLADERPYVEELSQSYSFTKNEIECEQDFSKIVNEVINAFDEPFGDDSVIPNYYICELTAKKVKVALSGLGGDELFAGYRRHAGIKLAGMLVKVPRFLFSALRKVVKHIPEPKNGSERIDHIKRFFNSISDDLSETYYGFMASIDTNTKTNIYSDIMINNVSLDVTKSFVTSLFNRPTSRDPVDCALYTDLKLYMPDQILTLSDRLSMVHSLEVRVPLADKDLIEHCANISSKYKLRGFKSKFLLKEIASGVLPASIIKHKKQGFEPPMAGWLKHELKDLLVSTLSRENLEKHGLFKYDAVQKLISDHLLSKQKNNKILFCLIMFQLWFNKFESKLV